MSKRIRKNASLQSVAIEARKRANAAKARWMRYDEAKRVDFGNHFWRDCQAREAFQSFMDLEEIASHLERLAGIEADAA